MQFSPTSFLTLETLILKERTRDENCRLRILGLSLEGCENEHPANGMILCVRVKEINQFFEFIK
jgi:hypothetical protein